MFLKHADQLETGNRVNAEENNTCYYAQLQLGRVTLMAPHKMPFKAEDLHHLTELTEGSVCVK